MNCNDLNFKFKINLSDQISKCLSKLKKKFLFLYFNSIALSPIRIVVKQKEETNPQTKKNVFAKLKSYNRDTSLKASTIPVDTKSVSKKIVPSTKEEMTEKIIKENANRYSYEGKLVNFNFLKKVDRKILDKRYAMSFSEFKKMKNL